MARHFSKLIFVLAASIALTSSIGPAYADNGPAGNFFQPYYPSSHYYSTPPTYDAVTNYDAFPPLLPLNALTNYYAPPVYGYVAPPPVSYPPPVYGWVLVRPISCGKYRYWNGKYCADARNALPYVGPR